VIVEKFEVLVAAWQVHATAWQFYRHTKEDKPVKQVVGAPKPASSRLRILSQGTSAARVISFRSPIARVLGASANKRAVS